MIEEYKKYMIRWNEDFFMGTDISSHSSMVSLNEAEGDNIIEFSNIMIKLITKVCPLNDLMSYEEFITSKRDKIINELVN